MNSISHGCHIPGIHVKPIRCDHLKEPESRAEGGYRPSALSAEREVDAQMEEDAKKSRRT